MFHRFNVFKAENIQRSLFPVNSSDTAKDSKSFVDLNLDSSFSFSRFCDWSPQEMEDTHLKSTFYALSKQNSFQKMLTWLEYANTWDYPISTKYLLLTASISLKFMSLITSNHNLFFTRVSCNENVKKSHLVLIVRCKFDYDRYRSIHSIHSLIT